MKRVTNFKFLVFGIMLTAGIALPFINDAEAATRAEIKRMVVDEAQNSRVPPSMALALAKVESDFQERALSPTGARGVMQIMPKTARDVFGIGEDELWNARLNIQLGIGYLEQLHDQYGGRWDLALSHYNGGTLKGGKGANARPHGYTRQYVADVLRWADRYGEKSNAWRVASVQPSGDGWQPAYTKSRSENLDQVRRVVVRELKNRQYDLRNKPWRFVRDEQPVRSWRKDQGMSGSQTDLEQAGRAKRFYRIRQSLDDFTPVVRWTEG